MRPCTVDDVLDLELLSDPHSSPDGTQIALVASHPDREADATSSTIEVVDIATGERRRLTSGTADRAPRWSPDGRWLAFLRGGSDPAQVWLLPIAGGEPHAVTTMPLGISELAWSPDGAHLAVTAPELLKGAQPHDPVVVTALVSKADGTGRLGPLTVHAHRLDVTTGEMLRLTSGDAVVRDIAWSPDGHQLALVTALHPNRDRDGSVNIFTVPAMGGDLTQVTRWGGSAASPTWTPDGDALVFGGSAEPLASGHTRLWRVPSDGGEPVELLPKLDRNIMLGGPAYPGARPHVTRDGDVVFCIREGGAVHLVRARPDGDMQTLVGGDVTVSGVTHDPLAGLVSAVRSTADLHLLNEDGPRRLVRTNAAFFDEVDVAVPEGRLFRAPDGLEVQGWVTGFRSDAPQPLLLDIHGGPHNAWAPTFDPIHAYHQLLAAAGWLILTVNPRGSDGYGEKFWTAARGAWGIADADDLLSAVDSLVEEGIADATRLAVTGYSYGGYMTCWLTTRTDRFAAAVPGGVVTDLVSFAGTSDVGGLFDVSEFGVLAADKPELLRDLSPLGGVNAVRTPTLILQGAADDRCPIGQAEQWFTALRTLGREVEMVLYPEGSHLFILSGRPSHRADWNRRVAEWVQRHTAASATG